MFRSRLTLAAVFTAIAVGLFGLAIAVFALLWQSSAATVQAGANKLRESALDRAEMQVDKYMNGTRDAMAGLQTSFESGACPHQPTRELESCLMSKLLSAPSLASIGFTHAQLTGYTEDGDATFAPDGRWSVEVYRANGTALSPLCTRWLSLGDGGATEKMACRPPEQVLLSATYQQTEIADAGVPLEDQPYFTTPASRSHRWRPLETSLFHSPHDVGVPASERRLVYSTVQAVTRADGGFDGVLDVSQVFGELSDIVRTTQVTPEEDAGFSVFLADSNQGFITGFSKDDKIVEDDQFFHVDPACAPPEVAAAVASPDLIPSITPEHKQADGIVHDRGEDYHATFRALSVGQLWAIGIVGPESYFLRALEKQRREMIVTALLLLLLVTVAGAIVLRSIRRALQSVQLQTDRITRFEFTGAEVKSPFRDVRDVLDSIEHAKTAVRAMGKYVPLDLVRQLFRDNVEPAPGGELRQISIMFTDIEGFTTLVEKEPPERLATWLGQYLSTMTTAIHSTRGTVDKFIGDAVMALWNAPSLDDAHVLNACRGALACIDATARLFASSEWAGRPALVTRFGLHRAQVMVGHFGAPDRLSYTAIGDGVNLASRLEGLNKEYGTRVLASEAVWQLAKDAFVFRKLDRVAVKGKAEAIDVYELLGERGVEVGEHVRSYEAALEAYFKRDFERAAGLLQGSVDPPSRVLRERCVEMQKTAPPDDWNGVWVLHSK